MKRLTIIICAICVICGYTSCSDMLENENSRLVFDPSLSEKTDSVYYALGVLEAMQQLADQYVFQGEMRGDLVKTTTYTDNNLRQLANFSATAANKYDSAYVYYRVINNCNYYIAHRDTTLTTGAEYVTMKEYVAIKALRAWAYLQLARTYGKVPFYTEPLTQISQIDNNDYPELDLEGIVARLAPDLEQYTGYQTPDFGNTVPAQSLFFPSRIFIPVDLVLGDMYLETENFSKAVSHYITYLTQVSSDNMRHIAYRQIYTFRMRGGNNASFLELPGDWDVTENSRDLYAGNWSDIFTTSTTTFSNDVISYIPMAQSKQQGATTEIPKAFGYDFYANSKGYIDEIQISPSDGYVELSNSTPYYYYSTQSTSAVKVFNQASLGDARYNAITHEDEDSETDSTTVWITKYNNARIVLYRTTTVYMHLAEALNRLGLYDAAFAILKDGINPNIGFSLYMRPETMEALQTTYPLLSTENISKFPSITTFHFGVHSHGTGYANDAYGNVYVPGMSPYQFDAVVEDKLSQISKDYGVTLTNSEQDIVNAVEDLLCDEYALEFAFEGSRFYDLCRLARHKNASGIYGGNFGSRWLARKLAYKNPVVNLEEPANWYLPFK